MHLIISSGSADNFILESIDAESPVNVLRVAIGERLGLDAATLKLVCDGVELLDGSNGQQFLIRDFYVPNLATIRVCVPLDTRQLVSDVRTPFRAGLLDADRLTRTYFHRNIRYFLQNPTSALGGWYRSTTGSIQSTATR